MIAKWPSIFSDDDLRKVEIISASQVSILGGRAAEEAEALAVGLEEPLRLARGQVVLGCLLICKIGRCRHGHVWLASGQQDPSRFYVVYVLDRKKLRISSAVRAFIANACIQVQLAEVPSRPSGIVAIDAVDASGLLYRRPWIRGSDLSQVPPGHLRESRVRELMIAICQSVDFLHSRSLTHGALTPPNIVVGEGNTPYVTDLSNLSGSDAVSRPDPTLPLLAPEQNRGGEIVPTPASDVYALGQLYFRLMGGVLPLGPAYDDRWPSALIESPLSRRDKHIVAQCIQSSPAARPQSAGALVEVLKAPSPLIRRPKLIAAVVLRIVVKLVAIFWDKR